MFPEWALRQVTHRLEELEFADGATCMEQGKSVFTGSGYAVKSYVENQKRLATQ
jgi:ABC-type transport system involved in cytochrome bd biosynthesis fused ATPase/permease subunit